MSGFIPIQPSSDQIKTPPPVQSGTGRNTADPVSSVAHPAIAAPSSSSGSPPSCSSSYSASHPTQAPTVSIDIFASIERNAAVDKLKETCTELKKTSMEILKSHYPSLSDSHEQKLDKSVENFIKHILNPDETSLPPFESALRFFEKNPSLAKSLFFYLHHNVVMDHRSTPELVANVESLKHGLASFGFAMPLTKALAGSSSQATTDIAESFGGNEKDIVHNTLFVWYLNLFEPGELTSAKEQLLKGFIDTLLANDPAEIRKFMMSSPRNEKFFENLKLKLTNPTQSKSLITMSGELEAFLGKATYHTFNEVLKTGYDALLTNFSHVKRSAMTISPGTFAYDPALSKKENNERVINQVNQRLRTIVESKAKGVDIDPTIASLKDIVKAYCDENGINLPIPSHSQDQVKHITNALMHLFQIPEEHKGTFRQILNKATRTEDRQYVFEFVDASKMLTSSASRTFTAGQLLAQPVPQTPRSSSSNQAAGKLVHDLNTLLNQAPDKIDFIQTLSVISKIGEDEWQGLSESARGNVDAALRKVGHIIGEQTVKVLMEKLQKAQDVQSPVQPEGPSQWLTQNPEKVLILTAELGKYHEYMTPDHTEEVNVRIQKAGEDIKEAVRKEDLLIRQALATNNLTYTTMVNGAPVNIPINPLEVGGVLAHVWMEPSPTIAGSSSGAPKASQIPSRAFKAVISIVEDPNIPEDVKIRLLNNITQWAQNPSFPKLTKHPELIRLAEEIGTASFVVRTPELQRAKLNLDAAAQTLKTQAESPAPQFQVSYTSDAKSLNQISSKMLHDHKPLGKKQIEEIQNAFFQESLKVFGNLDVSDFTTTPPGPSAVAIKDFSRDVGLKTQQPIRDLLVTINKRLNSIDERDLLVFTDLLNVLTAFHEIAALALKKGDLVTAYAIVTSIRGFDLQKVVDAKTEDKKIKKTLSQIGMIWKSNEKLARTFSEEKSYESVRTANSNALDIYKRNIGKAEATPPVPVYNIYFKDLTFGAENRLFREDSIVLRTMAVEKKTYDDMIKYLIPVKTYVGQKKSAKVTVKVFG